MLSDLPREIRLGRGRTRIETWIFWLLAPTLPLHPFLEPFLWGHVSPPLRLFIWTQVPARKTRPTLVFKTEDIWDRELPWWRKSWEAKRTMSQPQYEQPGEARTPPVSAGTKVVLSGGNWTWVEMQLGPETSQRGERGEGGISSLLLPLSFHQRFHGPRLPQSQGAMGPGNVVPYGTEHGGQGRKWTWANRQFAWHQKV